MIQTTCNKIILELKKHPEGMMIKDLSDKIKMNRLTVKSYLNYLLGKGSVRERKVGVAKLYYLVK